MATLMTEKELIIAYLEEGLIPDDKLYILAKLVSWIGGGHYNIDQELMTKLGYENYDHAKPQSYMDSLRDMGVPNEMLTMTVYDYTGEKRVFGELSSLKCRIIDKLLKD